MEFCVVLCIRCRLGVWSFIWCRKYAGLVILGFTASKRIRFLGCFKVSQAKTV